MATMNEDYDAAKIIKLEIDKVRQAMFNPAIEALIMSHLGVNQAKTPQAHMMRNSNNNMQSPMSVEQTPQ